MYAPDSIRTPRSRAVDAAMLLIVATQVFTLADTIQNFVGHSLGEQGGSFWWVFRHTLPAWIIIALLAPLPLGLGWRLSATEGGWIRALSVHAPAAAAFAALHLGLLAAFHEMAHWTDVSFATQMRALLGEYFFIDVIYYWAIAGSAHAWRYHRTARARELDAVALRAELAEARLAALRSQLQPHFLFNALNTVSMFARSGDSRGVVNVVADLSALLRHVLEELPSHEIPLGEELALIERYLAIEQARFGDRLRLAQRIAPASRSMLVPPMLLQPIVENAMHHGLGKTTRATEVTLTAAVVDDRLVLEVIDDGAGLSEGWSVERDAGVGLRNTASRLAQLYGEGASLRVERVTPRGVRARIELPARADSSTPGAVTPARLATPLVPG
jgi:two-component system LytT family sensor kinase